ncbi:MAG: hypothetical protein AAB355_01520 [Patescibacteria group bacterium]
MAQKIKLGFVAVLFIIMLAIAIPALFDSRVQSAPVQTVQTPTVREYSNAEVYAMAETIISPYLKAPSTAKFPSMSEVKISRLENDGFRVDGYVDSQNSFGAMLRSPFTTIFQYSSSSDKADIYAVVLDGETLLKRTPNGQ